GQTYVLTPTTVRRLGTPVVTYAGIDNFGLLGSAGSGTYRIDGTGGAGGTYVGGPGSYTIQGDKLTGGNTFFGGAGPDSFVLTAGSLVTGTVEVDGGGGSDSLTVIGTPGDDGIALHLTSAGGIGYLTGLGKRVTFAGVEAVGLDAAGGTNSFAWVDDTQTSFGSPANPAGGIVYKPTGPTSGQVTMAGGAVLPVVTFTNVNGTFGVNGDGDASGDPDALTVLGVSATGRQSALGEATAADGSD